MAKHFLRELDKIKNKILELGARVEEGVHLAGVAMEERDAVLSEKIIRSDHEIDEMEVEVEEECLKILALHQPVAIDLRFLVAVIKINNELERIGDQAVNIAQRVSIIAKQENPGFFFDYSTMLETAQLMLKQSLDALVKMDIDLAMEVMKKDDEVDRMQGEAYDHIKEAMASNPGRIGFFINLLLISRHIERLADHATNISEEVVYMIEGEIVRHGKLL